MGHAFPLVRKRLSDRTLGFASLVLTEGISRQGKAQRVTKTQPITPLDSPLVLFPFPKRLRKGIRERAGPKVCCIGCVGVPIKGRAGTILLIRYALGESLISSVRPSLPLILGHPFLVTLRDYRRMDSCVFDYAPLKGCLMRGL